MRWLFKAWAADAMLSGFYHVYERLSVDELPYFVNGGELVIAFALGSFLPVKMTRLEPTDSRPSTRPSPVRHSTAPTSTRNPAGLSPNLVPSRSGTTQPPAGPSDATIPVAKTHWVSNPLSLHRAWAR